MSYPDNTAETYYQCGQCKNSFYEPDFSLAAGLCVDCFNSAADDEDQDPFDSDSPSLSDIAAEHNILVDYMKYVHDCIDEQKLPIKYPEWVWSREASKYLNDIFFG